jgi:hypothetical protein
MELNFTEITKVPSQKQKNKFTYDDILSSLNMVVNDKGELQYMAPKQNTLLQYTQKQIEPELKNSSIYNKHFKNYKEVNNNVPIQTKQLTPQEYNQQVLLNKIKLIQEKHRISQIKSKKMFFINNNNINNYNNSIVVQQNNLNKLFKFG